MLIHSPHQILKIQTINNYKRQDQRNEHILTIG